MSYSSFSYSVNRKDLIDIQTKLNTLPATQSKELDGMFYRIQDFSESYGRLTTEFVNEYSVAWNILPRAKSIDELHGYVAEKLRPHTTGENHFITYTLSPLLRHYLNDACRLLEPTAPLLKAKFPNIETYDNESVGPFLCKAMESGVHLEFNAQFIYELYELWNDYKHRNTRGLHVTSWVYKDNTILRPQLALPKARIEFVELKNMPVDDFFIKLNKVFLGYFNFVI